MIKINSEALIYGKEEHATKKLLMIKIQSEALLYGKEEHATRVSVSLDDHFRRCKIANGRCCGSCSFNHQFQLSSIGRRCGILPWPALTTILLRW